MDSDEFFHSPSPKQVFTNELDCELTPAAAAPKAASPKEIDLVGFRSEEIKLSVPVSIKLGSRITESNSNVDEQFKHLSLHTPNVAQGRSDFVEEVKCARIYVEISYNKLSNRQREITNVVCEPMTDTASPDIVLQARDSDSSGHLGDISKTTSPHSGSPMTYIPPPPINRGRMSCTSSSSGSSLLSSAAALNRSRAGEGTTSRLNAQYRKWMNCDLLYHILDVIDHVDGGESLSEREHLPPTVPKSNLGVLPEECTPVSSRKRHPSQEDVENRTRKRLRPSTPLSPSTFMRLKGRGIFAKWQDRKYYFAKIVQALPNDRLEVMFLDSTYRTVRKDQIVNKLGSLTGHKVMAAEFNSDQYFPGIVTKVSLDMDCLKFTVATNNGDIDAGVGQIYFTEHQAKVMRQANADTSSSSPESLKSLNLYPSCSGTQKETQELGGTSSSSVDNVVNDQITHIVGCEQESQDPQNLTPTIKLKNVQGKPPRHSNKNEDSILGPLHIKGTWFEGLNFIITCSSRVPCTSTTEDVHTDSEDFQFSTIPFVPDRLVQQLTCGGGRVFDKFEDLEPDHVKNTYLITNRPCLTPKFIKCLAARLTIVCHEWVVNCTMKKKRLPLQELPIGWSIENSRFINAFELNYALPFSGLRIKVAENQDPNFCMFWGEVCAMVGGHVSKFTGNFVHTDLIVAENGVKNHRLANAEAFGVPIVSTAWVVQSLINGQPRSYDAHPSYNHLFEGSEESSN